MEIYSGNLVKLCTDSICSGQPQPEKVSGTFALHFAPFCRAAGIGLISKETEEPLKQTQGKRVEGYQVGFKVNLRVKRMRQS